MEAVFTTRAEGVIEIDLGDRWPGFNEALADAVTTRAQRGSDGVNPSTYWIDRVLAVLEQPADGEQVLAPGNDTDLVRIGDQVVAKSQHELFADEAMPLVEFISVLELWRAKVDEARAGAHPGSAADPLAGFPFVHWRVMLNTRAPEKAERLLGRLSEALGTAVEAPETKPYWKDPATTEAQFRTALGVDSPAEAVFGLLLQAARVSSGWQTSGPQGHDGDKWEFEAVAASAFRVSGVTWILCRTANFQEP